MVYRYEISEKSYVQTPLVLGQLRQLSKLLSGLVIPENISLFGLVSLLADRMPSILAVILTEEHTSRKDKDVEALAGELEFVVSLEVTLEIIKNFFELNNIISLSEGAAQIATEFSKRATGSKLSVFSLQKETSQNEMQFSGTTHSQIVNPISTTA